MCTWRLVARENREHKVLTIQRDRRERRERHILRERTGKENIQPVHKHSLYSMWYDLDLRFHLLQTMR